MRIECVRPAIFSTGFFTAVSFRGLFSPLHCASIAVGSRERRRISSAIVLPIPGSAGRNKMRRHIASARAAGDTVRRRCDAGEARPPIRAAPAARPSDGRGNRAPGVPQGPSARRSDRYGRTCRAGETPRVLRSPRRMRQAFRRTSWAWGGPLVEPGPSRLRRGVGSACRGTRPRAARPGVPTPLFFCGALPRTVTFCRRQPRRRRSRQ